MESTLPLLLETKENASYYFCANEENRYRIFHYNE